MKREKEEFVGRDITPLLTSDVPCTQGMVTKPRAAMNRVGGAMGVLMAVVRGNTTPALIWAVLVWLSARIFEMSPSSAEKALANHYAVDGIVVDLHAPRASEGVSLGRVGPYCCDLGKSSLEDVLGRLITPFVC